MKAVRSFKNLSLRIGYSGLGRDILIQFVLPALELAVSYDRVTSYFSVDSLLAVASGIDSLYSRGGKMRLIVGLHSLRGSALAKAAARRDDLFIQEIDRVRREIIEKAKTIGDVLTARKLATLAWMMCDGLLTVKVAWLPGGGGAEGGIFHSKSYVLEDEEGNVLAAVGSQNETVPGLGDNWERLSVFASWRESREYAVYERMEFNRLWNGTVPGLLIRALDQDFARSLIRSLPASVRERPDAERRTDLERFFHRVSSLPAFFSLAGPAALFPHQERAHIDGLSRWPIRLMLADEVGLGKTFEAGSIIRYCVESCGMKRVLILAPKAVVRQWQEELREHFGLEFWRFESSARSFVSPADQWRAQTDGEPVLSKTCPSLLIVSSQYARGHGPRSDIFSTAQQLPDMVVVDEAHAARLRADSSGKTRATRLLQALRQGMGRKVAHLVLVTATPLQLDWREYHALLDLLGLPPLWKKPSMFWESLSLLGGTDDRSLQSANICAQLIRDAATWYRPALARFDPVDLPLLKSLLAAPSALKAAVQLHSNWEGGLRLLAHVHPGGLLTIRNTRSALEALGYKFPQRQLFGPRMKASDRLQALYAGIEEYLDGAYYSVEQALYPEMHFSPGFVRSAYLQRLASTLTACKLTLQRRLGKVQKVMSGHVGGGCAPYDDCDEDEEGPYGHAAREATASTPVQDAARLEHGYLRELVRLCDDALEEGDPKIDALLELLGGVLERDRVLVYSRFTESLDACIRTFKALYAIPHACFTGEQSWIDMGAGPWPCSRSTIRDYLSDGKILVVFCSDAASEGINLQAARVLANIDVPWNPARLEQRIGRIARLGQPASVVDIHNFWYPGTVEERIYGRLIARKELFELAVGEFPDIIAKAIRNECADPGSFAWADAVRQLEALRRDLQLKALKRAWQSGNTKTSRSDETRRRLLQFLKDHRSHEPGLPELPKRYVAGERNVVSITHPALLALKPRVSGSAGTSGEVGFMTADGKDLGLAIRCNGELRLLGPEEFPDLLGAIVAGEPVSRSLGVAVPKGADAAKVSRLLAWCPDHHALSFGDEWPAYQPPTGTPVFSAVPELRVPVKESVRGAD